MVHVAFIKLSQILDSIHEFGHAGRYVVIAKESDGTVCDCFRSVTGLLGGKDENQDDLRLGIRTTDGDAVSR